MRSFKALPALPVLVVAVVLIVLGRAVTHSVPIAIAGYALLAVTIAIGLFVLR